MSKTIVDGSIYLKYEFKNKEMPLNFYENEIKEYIKDNIDEFIDDFDEYDIEINLTGIDEVSDYEDNKSDWEANYYYDCMKEGTLYEDDM